MRGENWRQGLSNQKDGMKWGETREESNFVDYSLHIIQHVTESSRFCCGMQGTASLAFGHNVKYEQMENFRREKIVRAL